ncbi:hypothetical protein C0993_010236 [Termitomyces sp. T159_Od127]|nr:hypothetical protein C0993_010236 [Termitomyces sp. T159_Od127]
MDEEVRLYTTNADREKYNNLATLFGITVALDYLERAFVRDSITAAELITLNGMKASEEITEEQSRQLLFDVEDAYAEFFRSLSGGKDDVS